MDIELYFGTVSSAAMGIDMYKLGKEIDLKYEIAIKYLSDHFFRLSEIIDYEFSSYELILARFYWPSDNFPENLGKTLDDFRLHSWLFAKDLSTSKEASSNKQKDLIHLCLELHRELLPLSGGRQFLAAA